MFQPFTSCFFFFFMSLVIALNFPSFWFFLGGLENPGVSMLCCHLNSGSTLRWWPVAIDWRRRWSCLNQPCFLATGRCNFTFSQKNLWSPNLISRWICRIHGIIFTKYNQTVFWEMHILFTNVFCCILNCVTVNPWLWALVFSSLI